MPGLLRRAQALRSQMRQRVNILPPPRKDSHEEDSPFSEEEHQEILAQIDELVAQDRVPIETETLSFTPQKKDSHLPLIFNLAAVAVLAVGVFLLLFFFNREEDALLIESSSLSSAEGRLLAALREESAQQLQEKEMEISQIQERLDLIREERDSIKSQIDERIRQREANLREKLSQELGLELQKLQAQGLNPEAIEKQLDTLRNSLESENQRQLEELRRQAAEEVAEKEAALNAQMTAIDQQLLQARQERNQLEASFAVREEELQARFEEQTAALETERDRATAQFNRLQEQRQQEQLIFDQLLSGYGRVQAGMDAGQYDQALQELGILESLLHRQDVAQLPAMQRRRGFENFVIATLKRAIQETPNAGTRQEGIGIETLKRIFEAVDEADRLLQAGDPVGARSKYLAAL